MRISTRSRARGFALALGLTMAQGPLGAPATAAVAPEPDTRIELRWIASDDPGSGGVFTDALEASPGDTGTLGVFVTPGARGLGGFDLDFAWDEGLIDGLDLEGVRSTPPAGWTGLGAPVTFESDARNAGAIRGLGASGVGAAPVFGETVQVAELTFRFTDNLAEGAPVYISPRVAGFVWDGAYQPLADAEVELGEAGVERQVTENEPSFRGPIQSYRFDYDLGGVRFKTGAILPETSQEPTRGAVAESQTDGGFGFLQTGFEIGSRLRLRLAIDASRLDEAGAFGGAELDSPFVPIGVTPQSFLFVGAARQVDGSLSLFASDGGAPVGATVNLPDDEVEIDWTWEFDRLSVRVGAAGSAARQTLLQDHPFPYLGSAGLGIGLSGAGRGDRLGVTFAASGDLYEAPRRKLLSELGAVVELENEAERLALQGDLAGAGEKLEEARRRIESGKLVPGSSPPRTVDALVDQVDAAVADAKLAAKIRKRLAKAARKDGKALSRIARGASGAKVAKLVQSATKSKLQAKAMIETLSAREKGKAL